MSGICGWCGGLVQRRPMVALLAVAAFALLAAWQIVLPARAGTPPIAERQRVVVSIPPLKSLVAALVGEDVQVDVVIPSGRSPHGYEPSPSAVARIVSADAVIRVGGHIDQPIGSIAGERAASPSGRRVISLIGLIGPDGRAGSPADEHLWLDPRLVRTVLPLLQDELRSAGIEMAEPGALEALLAVVDRVDAAYAERLAPLRGIGVLVHHDAWAVLSRRYGVPVSGVVHERATNEPSPLEVASLSRAVRERRARVIFVEPQLPGRVAAMLAEQGVVELGVLDPLGSSGDWSQMMLANLDELVRALSAAAERDTSEAVLRAAGL